MAPIIINGEQQSKYGDAGITINQMAPYRRAAMSALHHATATAANERRHQTLQADGAYKAYREKRSRFQRRENAPRRSSLYRR